MEEDPSCKAVPLNFLPQDKVITAEDLAVFLSFINNKIISFGQNYGDTRMQDTSGCAIL